MYTDVESLVITWLQARYPPAFCCSETPGPDEMAASLPVIRAWCIGGQDSQFTLDRSSVDIDCYATADSQNPDDSSRIAARTLAIDVWSTIRRYLPGYVTATGASVTRVATINQPSWRPYDNTDLRRVGMSLQVIVHTPAA